MDDKVVDTNVLLVASAAHPYSPFDDSHLPPDQQRAVFEWLTGFRRNPSQQLALDHRFRIYDEYRNKLTDQDYGLQVVKEKLMSLRQVDLEWEEDGTAAVPDAFAKFDRSDRVFLAAALTDPTTISIVNAADSDWLDIEMELEAAGVQVEHIVEDWLRAYHANRA